MRGRKEGERKEGGRRMRKGRKDSRVQGRNRGMEGAAEGPLEGGRGGVRKGGREGRIKERREGGRREESYCEVFFTFTDCRDCHTANSSVFQDSGLCGHLHVLQTSSFLPTSDTTNAKPSCSLYCSDKSW